MYTTTKQIVDAVAEVAKNATWIEVEMTPAHVAYMLDCSERHAERMLHVWQGSGSPVADVHCCDAVFATAVEAENHERRHEAMADPTFAPTLDDDGQPTLGVVHNGIVVHDVTRSECGRFDVNPFNWYGMTTEDVEALEEAQRCYRLGLAMIQK